MSEKENRLDKELEKNIQQSKDISEALKKMLIELEKQGKKNRDKKNK